jgi:hypothetical protein
MKSAERDLKWFFAMQVLVKKHRSYCRDFVDGMRAEANTVLLKSTRPAVPRSLDFDGAMRYLKVAKQSLVNLDAEFKTEIANQESMPTLDNALEVLSLYFEQATTSFGQVLHKTKVSYDKSKLERIKKMVSLLRIARRANTHDSRLVRAFRIW